MLCQNERCGLADLVFLVLSHMHGNSFQDLWKLLPSTAMGALLLTTRRHLWKCSDSGKEHSASTDYATMIDYVCLSLIITLLFPPVDLQNHLVLFTHISQLQKENYNAYIYITNGTSEVQTEKFVGHYSNQRVKYCQLARLFVKTCEIKHWMILCAVFFSFPDSKRNLGIYQVEVLRCG